MPRIRTIKPEFWTSLTVTSVPVAVRLTFIGLWNHCDDEGRALLEPRLLKAAIWPLDDEVTAGDVEGHVQALASAGLVNLYEVEGRQYLLISGWEEHQKVEKRRTSRLPAPPQPVNEESPSSRGSVGEPSPLEGKGKERRGKDQGKGEEAEGSPPPRRVTDSDLYRSVRGSLPEPYHAVLEAHLRASTNPPALLAELKAIATGMHPPAYDWPVIGRALHELAAAGGRLTPNALRGFCRKIAIAGPDPTGEPESDFARAAREVEAEANAHA
jgi:hypothetical protein